MTAEALFGLDDAQPAEPVDPKGVRELLFAGLLATLEADLVDAWPDYDHAEAFKDSDGTSRQGSPYWQAWHHAAGIRAVLGRVRGVLQTHEEYLVADRERSRTTLATTELECARHRDACPHCAENTQQAWRSQRTESRLEQVRSIYVEGLAEVIADADPKTRKRLQAIQGAAHRAWTKETPDAM